MATATADKTFTATVGPEPLVAGGTYSAFPRAPIVLTLTNTSTQAQLGSANVSVPIGLTATAVVSSVGTANLNGTVIELRNLNLQPGTLVTVQVSTQVECGANHASYLWAFQVKQANDFNGTPGNDLTGTSPSSTISGNCQLTYSLQPAHAEKTPTVITSKIYDPTGDPVTVSVLDGQGIQTVSWWSGSIALSLGNDPSGGAAVLSGGLSGSAVGGSVTFTPSISVSATGYSLVATGTPTAGSTSVGTTTAGPASNNFNIVDDATTCTAGKSCSASAGSGQKTGAKIDASDTNGAAGDLIILSINDPTVSFDCGSYVASSDLIVYNVTTSNGVDGSGRSKQATLTLLAQYVTKSASKYDVCYNSTVPFTTKSGAPNQTTGLLPTCATKNPVAPCVVSKTLDKFKNLVIVVSSPPGDPGLKF